MYRSNKKAVSIMVSYVLLISISIALSILVYTWLRSYASGEEIPNCPSGMSLIIDEYYCTPTIHVSTGTGEQTGWINISLKNKGRFTVDGFIARITDQPNSTIGIYTIDKSGEKIEPGNKISKIYNFDDISAKIPNKEIKNITYLEIQPFMKKNEKIVCKSVISQKIIC